MNFINNTDNTSSQTYAQGFLNKLKQLGFDSWDIKANDFEYMFANRKFRVLHDFFMDYMTHDKVLTDEELICFKDISGIMLDKLKSDKLNHKLTKSTDDSVFTFDSFSDDDNLLMLDDIEKDLSGEFKTVSDYLLSL